MQFITKSLTELPTFILRSQYYTNLQDLLGTINTGAREDALIDETAYIDTLDIKSLNDIEKIIIADLFFGFSFEDRVQILRNIHRFSKSATESLVIKDPKASFFAGQIHILLTEKEDHIIMVCMKLNYSELLEMAMQDNFKRMDYWIPGYSDMYYAAANTNVDCFRIGLKYGFPIDRFTVGRLARHGHPEMLALLISAGPGRFPITSKACEEAETIETIEFFLKHGFKMYYTTISTAAMKGNSEKMKYAIDHGCKIPEDVIISASYSKNIDCLKLAIIHSPIRSPEIMHYIIETDNLEVFNLALEHGFLVNSDCLKTITKSKCVNITADILSKYL
jgi:hypothetical protein